MHKYIVLGANGNIGSLLVEELRKLNKDTLAISRENLDIGDKDSLANLVKSNPHATYVNCMAFMPADKCETESNNSEKINFKFVDELTGILAEYSESKFIQLSTDFIFDGMERRPYKTNSLPNPINQYGKHKYLAEIAVKQNMNNRGQIIRFASLVANTKKRNTFLDKITDRALKMGEISVVEDLRISIATAPLVIESILQSSILEEFNIHHAVHQGEATWKELAELALLQKKIESRVQGISHLDLNLPAKRPEYSVLEPSKLGSLDHLHWAEAVANYLDL